MPNSRKKKQVNIEIEIYDKFERVYPELTNLFLNRALKVCLNNKDLFDQIFFSEQFLEVK